MPRYLEWLQIVTRDTNDEVQISVDDRWSEPLVPLARAIVGPRNLAIQREEQSDGPWARPPPSLI